MYKDIRVLDKSIEVWQNRANGIEDKTFCPCCEEYRFCEDCPIARYELNDDVSRLKDYESYNCCAGKYLRWYIRRTVDNAKIVLEYLKLVRADLVG